MSTVERCMTRPATTIPEEERVEACARALEASGFRHLPTIDRMGRVAGMVTRAEVAANGRLMPSGTWLPASHDVHGLTARDIAQDCSTCMAGDALRDVLALVLTHPLRAVVVVDSRRRPLGIITERDAVRMATEMLPLDFALGALQTDLITVDAATELGDALRTMDSQGLRHLLVAEDGKFQSVLDRDELIAQDAWNRRHELVGDVMRWSGVPTGPADLPLGAAAVRMHRDGLSCLPLVDREGMLVDIITRTDVIYALVDVLEAQGAQSR